MLWRLQYRLDSNEEWVDAKDMGGKPLKKFSSFTEAFEYHFVKYSERRSPEEFQYRLAPSFSTRPVEVMFTPRPPVRQPGTWTTANGQLSRRVGD